MESNTTDFNCTVKRLLELSKPKISNTIPDHYEFIKCYDVDEDIRCVMDVDQFELYCFVHKERYSAEHIAKDITSYAPKKGFVNRVHLTLYYVTVSSLVILVQFSFSKDNSVIHYDMRWHTPAVLASSNEPIDLNEYVDSLLLKSVGKP